MYFPLELPLGKHIPLYGSIPGRSFRLRRHPETAAKNAYAFSLRPRPAQSSILRGTGGDPLMRRMAG